MNSILLHGECNNFNHIIPSYGWFVKHFDRENACKTYNWRKWTWQYNCGVTVITKSDRILRDIDLYERINRHAKAVIQITLTTADENLCRIIEPNVCTTHRRYEVLKELQRRGIPTVVWLCPILPYINARRKI